jgi:hypothetical protein
VFGIDPPGLANNDVNLSDLAFVRTDAPPIWRKHLGTNTGSEVVSGCGGRLATDFIRDTKLAMCLRPSSAVHRLTGQESIAVMSATDR